MTFDEIRLNRKERRALRALSQSDIFYDPPHRATFSRLESVGLAMIYPRPGKVGDRGVTITEAGISFLRWHQSKTRDRWLDRLWGFLSGVVVTVIAGVILQTLIG